MIALYAFASTRKNLKSQRDTYDGFKDKLAQAIIYSQPSWTDLLGVANTCNMKGEMVISVLWDLNAEILSGQAKGSDLEQHKDLISEYISMYNELEQFKELPPELRNSLEKLSDVLTDENKHLLEPLTKKLKDLLEFYEKDNKQQRKYAFWGLVVTIASLLFALYTYFSPKFTESDLTEKKTTAQIQSCNSLNKKTYNRFA